MNRPVLTFSQSFSKFLDSLATIDRANLRQFPSASEIAWESARIEMMAIYFDEFLADRAREIGDKSPVHVDQIALEPIVRPNVKGWFLDEMVNTVEEALRGERSSGVFRPAYGIAAE